MPPKKKLSKKEKARLEAEQAELLRIEMEKEKQRKLEEERQRRQIEREQAKQRLQQEIAENKQRRAQLKNSMIFFDAVKQSIDEILNRIQEESDWDKYMRCNGLPNANIPSDLRKYMHQWKSDIERRNRESRNWLLRTDERSLLTHDENVENLTRENLRKQQGNLGDVYSMRIKEVLGILSELDDALADTSKPPRTSTDLKRLKAEIRIFLREYLDDFTYKLLSYIERDMEIDRPGVSKHIYSSDVFKSHIWAFAKDAQISVNPKGRIGEQNQHNEIDFPIIELVVSLPPTVSLPCSALRGLWLSYDHLSDNCNSFEIKRPRPNIYNMLTQTKKEWRKRKEILQNMLDDCTKESSPLAYSKLDSAGASSSQKTSEQSKDVDKLYTEYEDELNKARRHAIGPESFNLAETDVNLRKYRIIGGVYCVDYLDTPQQDKRLNARSFIRTILSAEKLTHRGFYQTYKPPPPVQPGVRRLPEEIEAEMRMMEAALEKLALVTVQLPDSVIWFEPPIVCRWETQIETIESQLAESSQQPTTATPTDATPRSTTTNLSPLKSSPRFTAKMRKRSSQKTAIGPKVQEISDFDMYNIPSKIDIYGLIKDFVVPRLPQGFCVRLEMSKATRLTRQKDQNHVVLFARHKSINTARPTQLKNDSVENEDDTKWYAPPISQDFLEDDEPQEFFPHMEIGKVLKFKESFAENLKFRRKSEIENRSHADNSKKVSDAEDKNGSTGKMEKESLSQNSQESSRRSSEDTKGKNSIRRTSYMFSELIEDLDRLCELQMPLKKQEQALKKISEQLSSPASSNGSNEPIVKEQDPAPANVTESIPPAFAYYTGISFIRDLEATKADSTKDKNNENEEADNDESSSEWDDAYDDDDYYSCNVGEENDADADADAEAATTALSDFLSKQSQTESSSGREGIKARKAHMEALKQGKWSIRDVHDTKFNEDKLTIQFRTGRLGIFGFALNRYSNMPYQTWEIKPDLKCPGTVLFSFTASIVSLDMTITSAGYCVNNFQGGVTDAINEMIGKTYSLAQLKDILISSAVDIFPEEDAFCYTEGSCEKNYVMEMHLYACMSTLAQSHNFSWSRWNLLAGSRTVILLIRELQEGKKVPSHSTLCVTPLKTAIIECTEVSASFNAVGIPGMEYYADLYQLSQVHALPSSLEKQRTMDPVLRENVARILMAVRPLSFC